MDVAVAYYPPGASKWNPIEHRLFSEISKNWAGRPLESYETILNFNVSERTLQAEAVLVAVARLFGASFARPQRLEEIDDVALDVLRVAFDTRASSVFAEKILRQKGILSRT